MINLHEVLGTTGPHDARSQGLSRTKLTLKFHQPEPESFLGNISEDLNYGKNDDAEDHAEVRVDRLSNVSAVDEDIASPSQPFLSAAASERRASHFSAKRHVSPVTIDLPLS